MPRHFRVGALTALALGLALLSGASVARAEGLEGSWRLPVPGPDNPTFLIHFDKDGSNYKASYLGATGEGLPNFTVSDVTTKGERFRFALKLPGREFVFDGLLPAKAGDKARGGFTLGRAVLPTTLEPSKLTKFDADALKKEVADNADRSPPIEPAPTELAKAIGKKEPAEAVSALVEKRAKTVEPFGPYVQRRSAEQGAQVLLGAEGFAELALVEARRAEKLLDPTFDDAGTQLDTLTLLRNAITKAGKKEGLAEIEPRLKELEAKEAVEYEKKMVTFKPEKFEGRKGKGTRVVLVELFTGAQCPPCVAADLGFDALSKTYGPAEVALLQYHLHIPGPDALTNADSEKRQEYYDSDVQGTPSLMFDGKAEAGGGGGVAQARNKYGEFRAVIDTRLEVAPKATLSVSATLKDGVVQIQAKASDVEKPGDKVRLRVVLAEETARYSGSNGIKYHHSVVRSYPGGVGGKAVAKTGAELTASVKLSELRTGLNEYLDKFTQENPGVTFADRPLALKKLKVIAFVQDDDTHEVLQAGQVEVSE